MTTTSWFTSAAKNVSRFTGGPLCFGLAVGSVLVCAITGPMFGYSETWQMVINTGTTIITFLMVFLIQSTQNRDAKATQLKLDELIHGVKGARTSLVDLEDLSDEELEKLQRQFQRLHKQES